MLKNLLLLAAMLLFAQTALAIAPWWEDGELSVRTSTVALWHFNEGSGTSAADSNAGKHNLTLSNSAAWSAASKFGAATFFPNQLYSAADADFWQYELMLPSFSVGFWVKMEAFHSGQRHFESLDFGANDFFMVSTADQTMAVYLDSAGNPADCHIHSITVPAAGTWYHILITVNDTNSAAGLALRVNGVLEGRNNACHHVWGAITDARGFPLYIGSNYNGTSLFFDGFIDEFVIESGDMNATMAAPPAHPILYEITPATDSMTTDPTPTFTFSGADVTSCTLGFYFNGALDYNTSVNFNVDGNAARTYLAMEKDNDIVHAVVNSCSNDDYADDPLVLASADFILQQEKLAGANPHGITDKDFVQAGKYGLYNFFAELGKYAGAIIIFVLGLGFFIGVIWLATRSPA